MIHETITRPRRLVRAWIVVRDGLPSFGRYRRYVMTLGPALLAVWLITGLYLAAAPTRYTSTMTLILPGSGVGGSMNVESIGQASTVSASAFSSATLSPTENYKRLLGADVTLRSAARLAHEPEDKFPEPVIKLTDQTNLIEISITGDTPESARRHGLALRKAFLDGLDRLRRDEAAKRESTDRARVADLGIKVRDAQRRLIAFQGASGLVSLEQFNQRITTLDALQDRERIARTSSRQRDATTAALARSLQTTLPDVRAAFLLKADPLFQSLLSRYAAIGTQATERGAVLGARHSLMAETTAEADSLRAALVKRGSTLTHLPAAKLLGFVDLSVADGRARMFETLVTNDGEAAGNAAALDELHRQIAEQSAQSAVLVRQASMLTDLVRDQRIAEAVFSSALARLDTNKADPFASYPLVQTLDDPSLPRRRSSPSTALALAGAVAASLLLLTGFVLLWLRQPIIRKLLPNA